MFLCGSKRTLFGLPKLDVIRNHWLRFVYNRTVQPNVQICATHFMDSFMNLGQYKAGCAQRLFKKKGQFLNLLLQSGASESATVSMFCY